MAVSLSMIVTDSNKHCILIWNIWPNANGQDADVVLGEPDFTSNVGRRTSSLMKASTALFLFENQLIVTDGNNSRYLVFNGTY